MIANEGITTRNPDFLAINTGQMPDLFRVCQAVTMAADC